MRTFNYINWNNPAVATARGINANEQVIQLNINDSIIIDDTPLGTWGYSLLIDQIVTVFYQPAAHRNAVLGDERTTTTKNYL